MLFSGLIFIYLLWIASDTTATGKAGEKTRLLSSNGKFGLKSFDGEGIGGASGKNLAHSKTVSKQMALNRPETQALEKSKLHVVNSTNKEKQNKREQKHLSREFKRKTIQGQKKAKMAQIARQRPMKRNSTENIKVNALRNKKEKINVVDPRGPSSNMITDLRIANMGQAMQESANENSSKGAEIDHNKTNLTQDDQSNAKIKSLLHVLGDDYTPVDNTSPTVNSTSAVKNVFGRNHSKAKDVKAQKKQIIGPGYYEPECDDEKKCPDGHYCDMYVCIECHRSKHACTDRVQCCNNMECVYGRCENKPKGSPGSFCHKDKDCAGDACCVLEPTIDEHESICKPKLSEYHQCSPILFRKLWIGDNKPDCGPCKDSLQCSQRGNEGNHEVCMKKP